MEQTPFVPLTYRWSPQEVQQLPLMKLPSTYTIVEVRGDAEARRAVADLMTYDYIGFDIETPPVFVRGQRNAATIASFAVSTHAYIIYLPTLGREGNLSQLFEDPESPFKCGVGVYEDVDQLDGAIGGLQCIENVLDLKHVAPRLGCPQPGLRNLYATMFGMRLAKSQQLSQWGNPQLTRAQLQYAALDAYAGVHIAVSLAACLGFSEPRFLAEPEGEEEYDYVE
jgi:hypothetical protein